MQRSSSTDCCLPVSTDVVEICDAMKLIDQAVPSSPRRVVSWPRRDDHEQSRRNQRIDLESPESVGRRHETVAAAKGKPLAAAPVVSPGIC